MSDFETFSKKTFYFAIGAVNFAVEKTEQAVRDITEQTQNFIEEMSERGQEVAEPKVQYRQWNTTAQKQLWEQLMVLVARDEDLANRLISSAKTSYPGHSEGWYLDKVIHDLERDRNCQQ